jgi:hypothetical protein
MVTVIVSGDVPGGRPCPFVSEELLPVVRRMTGVASDVAAARAMTL